MLKKRDKFINWYATAKVRRDRIGEMIRVYAGKNNYRVVIGRSLAEKVAEEPLNVKMAIALDGTETLITFNPNSNVPFVRLRATGNNKSPFLYSKDLSEKFVKAFDLDQRRCKYHEFHLAEHSTVQGQILYALELKEGGCDE